MGRAHYSREQVLFQAEGIRDGAARGGEHRYPIRRGWQRAVEISGIDAAIAHGKLRPARPRFGLYAKQEVEATGVCVGVDKQGRRLNRTMGIAGLGGATLDNEENYLMKKLYTALGAIQIENQARI